MSAALNKFALHNLQSYHQVWSEFSDPLQEKCTLIGSQSNKGKCEDQTTVTHSWRSGRFSFEGMYCIIELVVHICRTARPMINVNGAFLKTLHETPFSTGEREDEFLLARKNAKLNLKHLRTQYPYQCPGQKKLLTPSEILSLLHTTPGMRLKWQRTIHTD